MNGQQRTITLPNGQTMTIDSAMPADVAERVIKEATTKAVGAPPSLPSLGKATRITGPETWGQTLQRYTVGELPAIGATVGGIGGALAGGPTVLGVPAVAAGGAALGGAAGEFARQRLQGVAPDVEPPTAGEEAWDVAKQGLLGAATEFGGPYINRFFKWMAPFLRRSSERALVKVMAPATARARGEAVGAAGDLLDTGGYATATRGQLLRRAEAKVEQAGGAVRAGEAAISGKLRPTQDVLDALNEYERELMLPPRMDPKGQIMQFPKPYTEAAREEIKYIRNTVQREGASGNISRGALVNIKQSLDEARNAVSGGWAGRALREAGAIDPIVAAKAKAQERMANDLRDIMHTDEPELAKLYATLHTWLGVKHAMSPGELAGEFEKPPSTWSMLWRQRYVMWIAGLGGATHYYGAEGAEAIGALFAISKLVQSPLWKTVLSAKAKNALASSMADDLSRGAYEQAALFATRALVQGKVAPAPTGEEPPPEVKAVQYMQSLRDRLLAPVTGVPQAPPDFP
jgi:hypothetical protein